MVRTDPLPTVWITTQYPTDSPIRRSLRGFDLLRLTLAVLVVMAAAACVQQSPRLESRSLRLIDGERGLENFYRVGDANWRPLDGTITADAGNGYLVSKRSYSDFRLRAEFWASSDANSGIFLRVTDPQAITPKNSYEVNIFDQRPDPSYGTGAIVEFAKVSPMPKAGGRWNTYEITAHGPHIVVVLNGRNTLELQDESFRSGPIALQSARGTIRWRKVEIEPL